MLETWNDPTAEIWTQRSDGSYSRTAGLNEIGFYHYALSSPTAPSDCLCRVLATFAPDSTGTFTKSNFFRAWRTLRLVHPLLDSTFKLSNEHLQVHFTHDRADWRARESLRWFASRPKWGDIRNDIMNGARIISDEKLSELHIYEEHTKADNSPTSSIEIVLITSHAISDGLSLVMLMNDLLHFLAVPSTTNILDSDDKIIRQCTISRLPAAMESQLPRRTRTARQLWTEAIAYVMVEVRQKCKRNQVVATFPAVAASLPVTRQKVYEFSIQDTKSLRQACKRRRCTMGHLIYAASCAAHTELTKPPLGSTVSIGSPISARRLFDARRRRQTHELVLALAFLDITLPSVLLCGSDRKSNVRRLWNLAHLAKKAVHEAIEDPVFPICAHILQENRVARFIPAKKLPNRMAATQTASKLSFGSSAIGDLDKLLHTSVLPFQVSDFSLAMRARSGESLMHSYSINGKLRLSLVYDNHLGEEVMQSWLNKTSQLMHMAISLAPQESASEKSRL